MTFALSGWLAVTSVSYLDDRALLKQAREQIRTLQQSNAELSSQADVLTATLLEQIEELEGRAAERDAALGEARRINAALHEQLEGQAQELATVRERLEQAEQQRAEMERAVVASEEALTALAEERAELTQRLRVAENELAAVSAQRDASRRAAADLSWQLALLNDQAARSQSDGMTAQLWIKDWVLDSVEALEHLLGETGVDVERLIARAASGSEQGQGGPFQAPEAIAAAGAPLAVDDPVSGNIQRLAALQRITRTLPLASPLDQFFVTSPYGKRRDPFTKVWAHHAGVDLGAPRLATILASAPGRVVAAGPAGPYGNLVEIDHGLGIVSRYGHLDSIEVAAGEEVAFRQALGTIGNTGRSTSRHLHYEIRIDDRALDPARFLNAGRLLVGIFDAPRLASGNP